MSPHSKAHILLQLEAETCLDLVCLVQTIQDTQVTTIKDKCITNEAKECCLHGSKSAFIMVL